MNSSETPSALKQIRKTPWEISANVQDSSEELAAFRHCDPFDGVS
jgi:hypothetical protein